MSKVVTFGEIMGRLAPPGFLRLPQAMPGSLDVTFAGAEANVAASLSILGLDAHFVTALPNNPIADACVNSLRSIGIDTSSILRSDIGRLGLYFLETGANQRPSRVIYDRDGSTIGQTPADAYDWDKIFVGADWFHVTGITPAVSQVAAEATLHAAKAAKQRGLTVSCDLNFRGKLWRWDSSASPHELAGRTMRQLLPLVDVLIANEEDCGDVLQIRAAETDVASGKLSAERYPEVARRVVQEFPNLRYVATTLRESISASHNNWGAMLYDAAAESASFAPRSDGEYEPYSIRNIVDRVGGGDSFAAGLIFGLLNDDYPTPQAALQFAVAASCLAHSIIGDLNFSSREEIDALAKGSASGRVVR
ncbi:PfkB family carbohydrate kinase [Rosistilla oblonga]|uniref:PfkB family carbohydrate kinase n=1 Tax=Rosistilla oblonga TaxID=2527990 RepID=UPI003A96EA44